MTFRHVYALKTERLLLTKGAFYLLKHPNLMDLRVLMQPNLGLAEKDRFNSAELLNHLLADEYVLYTKTRSFHWNVTGSSFHDLHLFFEAQYRQLDEIVDLVAERVRMLGVHAFGTLAQFSHMARLPEGHGEVPGAREMLQNLLGDHERLVSQLRKDVTLTSTTYGDAGTSNFLTVVMEQHERMAWMIRSFLM